MTHEAKTAETTYPRVEASNDLPEALGAWRDAASRLLRALPVELYDGIEAVTLTDKEPGPGSRGRHRSLALGELLGELPPGLVGRHSISLCLTAYGLFRAVLGLPTREEAEPSTAACRSARGASHLAAAALEALYPRHPVVRAVRLSCDDDFQRLRLNPKETWRRTIGMLTVIGAVTALGLWNLAAPFSFGAFSQDAWAALWGANRFGLGLLEASLLPLFLFRRTISPANRGLLTYLWALAAANLADPVLGTASGYGLLTVNLLGLVLVALGSLAALQKSLQGRLEAPEGA